MKRIFYKSLILVAVLMVSQACENDKTMNILNPSGFEIQRGTNLSHWLSQDFGWEEKYTYIKEADIEYISKLGFDHVRIPVDEIELWDEDGNKVKEAFSYLHACLGWCEKYDLNAIVDLHTIRSHHFNAENEGGHNTLWTEIKAQDQFVDLWVQLSAELKDYPVNKVAYELMNEAVAPDHEDWNKLINRGIQTIRENEPKRVIVVGSNMWQVAPNLKYLRLPEGDKNIILSFHTYSPLALTHYKAGWTPGRDYNGPVHYPGQIITDAEYEEYVDTTNTALVNMFVDVREVYNKERLLAVFSEGVEYAKSKNLQLYCGEFGCLPTIDRKDRLAFYNDQIQAFEEQNIAWCNWEYKGDFGIYFWDSKNIKSKEPDTELIDILLQFKK